MGTAAAIGAIVSAVVGAVGAGVSYHASSQASKAQGNIALMNAQSASQAARQQGQLANAQAQAQQVLAGKERAAALANAAALRQQADAGSRISQENTRRNREEMARMIALQRAQVGKAGFVDSGSPLQLLAQSAEEEQRQSDAFRYKDEMSRRGLFREATIQENEGILAGMTGTNAAISGMAAMQQANLGMSQARLDAYAGRAAANAMRSHATGQFLSTAGGLGAQAYDFQYRTPRTAEKIPKATPDGGKRQSLVRARDRREEGGGPPARRSRECGWRG